MGGNEANAVRYRIDAAQSRFIVRAEASGLLSVFGHNPTIAVCGFGGDARCVPGTLGEASLLMLVKADSLAVVGDVSEKDRREMERMMRDEVLDIARYPEIVFMSTKISATRIVESQHQARITGSLSLHGVTRDHSIDARVMVNGGGLRAQGEFLLRQSDYNIKPVSVAGGTLKLKDELKLTFDISAIADCGLRIERNERG
jgi:polyisoprenoid-binding protein YceI